MLPTVVQHFGLVPSNYTYLRHVHITANICSIFPICTLFKVPKYQPTLFIRNFFSEASERRLQGSEHRVMVSLASRIQFWPGQSVPDTAEKHNTLFCTGMNNISLRCQQYRSSNSNTSCIHTASSQIPQAEALRIFLKAASEGSIMFSGLRALLGSESELGLTFWPSLPWVTFWFPRL